MVSKAAKISKDTNDNNDSHYHRFRPVSMVAWVEPKLDSNI